MNSKTLRFGVSAILLCPVFFGASARAEGVGAGVLIENTAQAEYESASGTQTVTSNTVTLRVNELIDVAVTSTLPGPQTVAATTATFPFEISNTGNGPEAFLLAVNTAVAGNDFALTVNSIAIDRNGNGLFDAGIDDVLTSPATTALLPADGLVTVLVNVTLPAGAADGNRSRIELTATSATGSGAPGTVFAGQGEGGVDAVVGASTAIASATGELQVSSTAVQLTKSAAVTNPFGGTTAVPRSVITYTIVAQVSGSGTARGLVVNDPFPAGTTYRPGTLRLDSTLLTDGADSDAGTASTTGIRVNLGDVAGGTSHSISFDVAVN